MRKEPADKDMLIMEHSGAAMIEAANFKMPGDNSSVLVLLWEFSFISLLWHSSTSIVCKFNLVSWHSLMAISLWELVQMRAVGKDAVLVAKWWLNLLARDLGWIIVIKKVHEWEARCDHCWPVCISHLTTRRSKHLLHVNQHSNITLVFWLVSGTTNTHTHTQS